MRPALLELLRCPDTGSVLKLTEADFSGDEIQSGWLENATRTKRYPIRDFVPRFVPETNYADNFGLQWNKFSRTQLDSFSGHPISTERFWRATGWDPASLRDEWVLDAGCGAGRFAEVALQAGARVIAVDYSSAVNACYRNLGQHPNLSVLQANIYSLPLLPRSFPYVYSLGVLQHTPDVRRAFHALPPMLLADGAGRLCVDFYERSWKSRMLPRYWLRPITKRMDKAVLFRMLEHWVPRLLALSNGLAKVPMIGSLLMRPIPVANYRNILPLDERQHAEWALLDTFDWLAPQYDQPQDAATIRTWLQEARMIDVEVLKAGHLVGRGRSGAS